MHNFVSFYQHLPEKINPVAFNVGSFSVNWYSLMYVTAVLSVYGLLVWRLNKKEADYGRIIIEDLLFYAIFGLLVGARLGYVLFYDFSFFAAHPVAIISPYDFGTGKWTGIYGMSYHGGLIGILLAGWIFAKKYKLNFWRLADFVIPAIPAGYFFGRIGNFLNGELYGRVTDKAWGMFFPSDWSGHLRHPSQLYEAFFEGIILFIILWMLRNNKKLNTYHLLLPVYLSGYGVFRFLIEFFREPDAQIGFIFVFLTLGQIFSLVMIAVAGGLVWLKKEKAV